MSNIDYRELLDQIAKVIEVDGEERGGYHYVDLPNLVHQYGTACNLAGQSLISRHRQEDIDAWKASLPEPDDTNPDHWRFAANLIPGDWRLQSGDRAISSIFNEEADRLDAARSAERKRLDEVVRIIHAHDDSADAARALDAAGLLRGGGRGE
ncbi:hypothetical protein SEA_MOOSEHEAD_57 [Gordonia phage Moosehead]|nr:hypothetical protein SEA_MOOSEHEAD_57 [Gordonia phage Moosehead]